MDGASLWTEFRHVVLPLSVGGIASCGLLCLVLSWNEAFWALNLTSAKAGTLATLIASYSSPEGLFWAKLSAASLMAIAPIVVFRLVLPKATGAGPDLRRRQVIQGDKQHGLSRTQEHQEKLRRCTSSGASTRSARANSSSSSARRAAAESTLLRLIAGLEPRERQPAARRPEHRRRLRASADWRWCSELRAVPT